MACQGKRWGCVFCTAVFASCLLWQGQAWATQSPLEVIRTATNQALTILQDPSSQGEENNHKRIEKMWATVLPYFDTQEIAQRALGVHWEELTEEQRRDFVQLFVQFVKRNYSETLDRYTKDAQFFSDHERIEGNFAEVHTRLQTSSRDDPFSLVYRLHQEDKEWLIHDVIAENVSMVQNYRRQFTRIIDKSSYEGLVQAMKEKLNELESSTAS